MLEVSPKAERYAEKLAEATGLSVSDAVEEAVRAQLFSVVPEARERPSMEELLAIIRRADAEPRREGALSDDDLLGYNELEHSTHGR